MEFSKKHLVEIKDKLINKMSFSIQCAKTLDGIPYSVKDGKWTCKEISWWANGFWAGEMWQMYLISGYEDFRNEALRAEKMMDAALSDTMKLHHDVGFMWLIQSGVHYAIEGNEDSFNRTFDAANILAGRFNPNGFIRAWNGDRYGWSIIDTMMNLNLLFWASRVTKDPRYKLIAMSHADTAMKYFVREDGSCNHIVIFDPETGAYLDNPAGQGFASGSSWSRGQSWALYGFVLAYMSTGKKEYLDTSRKVADYFISQLKDDAVPKCDFCQPDDELLYDDAAGAIAVSGLIELSKNLPEEEGKVYWNEALRILNAMDARDADYSESSPAILTKCTGSYHANDHHIAMNYADYFYIEAIGKLLGEKLNFWAPDISM